MIWDTLYGFDEDYKPQPQMVEGHTVEDDGKRVTIEAAARGCSFHDGEPVRARDAVASIRRWAARDALGQVMLAQSDASRGAGRPHHRVPPQEALPAAVRRAGQAAHARLLHHAGALGADGPGHRDHGR